jgi:hypothetical protein
MGSIIYQLSVDSSVQSLQLICPSTVVAGTAGCQGLFIVPLEQEAAKLISRYSAIPILRYLLLIRVPILNRSRSVMLHRLGLSASDYELKSSH